MKVAVVQTHIIWENAVENRSHLSQIINGSLEEIDLIVLPEMFSTGFTMHPKKVSETMQGDTILWLQHLAQAKNCAITGSLVIEEQGKFYNRLVFVFPDGTLKHYDKRHLFSLAGEHKEFSAGKNRLIVEYKGWRICPLICYDLRFPVFSRNSEEYDLLIYVANWPEVRSDAWNSLLKARAIENMTYTIGVNRIGQDENKNKYFGDSQIIDCMGNYVVEPYQSDSMIIAELDQKKQDRSRKKFGFLNDADGFKLI